MIQNFATHSFTLLCGYIGCIENPETIKISSAYHGNDIYFLIHSVFHCIYSNLSDIKRLERHSTKMPPYKRLIGRETK